MLDSLTKKQKFIFFIILIIMLLIIFYYIYSVIYSNNFSYSYNENNNLINNELIDSSNSNIIFSEDSSPSFDTIVVYICGAVKENSRVCDAIELAGGLTQDADLTNINLAYILEDGEKIYIPHKGEQISSITSDNYTNSPSNDLKININKASQTELETIPGIGPSTALKIINYRNENGKFSKIEDIKNVSGIGDAKYEKIKEFIKIK